MACISLLYCIFVYLYFDQSNSSQVQKAISILLILCLTVQTFNRLSIITSYQLNKAFITEVFCVNKAKPELHCEG